MSSHGFSPAFGVQDVQIEQQQRVFHGFVQVDAVTLRHRCFADGQWLPPIRREIVRRRAAAGVIVHDPVLGKFLLIEQFRAGALQSPLGPWQLEVIAGLIDDGEDAKQCLRREAREEAGCELQELTRLYQFYPSAGATDETYALYAATADLSQAGGIYGQADEGEDIRVHVYDLADAPAVLAQLDWANAPVLLALQWLISQLPHLSTLAEKNR